MEESGELVEMSAHRVVQALARGDLTAERYTAGLLRRCEAGRALNAFITLESERVLEAARGCDLRRRGAGALGALHGLPVAIKDSINTRDYPTTAGTAALRHFTPAHDAAIVDALTGAGAIVLGKTNLHELSFGWTSNNRAFGPVRNPYDTARIAGGSSGGSAAAVLAGVCPMAIGTDAGGSIRIPASFSGVFGHKPTFGRVGLYPPSAFGDVSHVGPMSRTVADSALMLDAIKGPDSRDWYSLPDDGVSYHRQVGQGSLKGKRVALSPTLGYHEPTPAVRAAVEQAAKVFADLGAVVEEADPFTESPQPVFQALALGGFWALLRSMTPEKVAVMDPGLVAACRAGEAVTQEQYIEAIGRRSVIGARLRQFFDRYDILLSPTMPITAPYAEPHGDGQPDPTNYPGWLSYTWAFNLTRNPSASIPCGLADGLPIGLMVTGPLYDDLGVLQACHAYEEAAVAAWPGEALAAALAKIVQPGDRSATVKIKPVRDLS